MSNRAPKPDRIINDEAIGNEDMEAIYHALKPLDKIAKEMEAKWGVDRLPSLVSVDMASSFGIAKAQLDQAIDAEDVAMVKQKANAMIRGWQALDAYATTSHATIIDLAAAWCWRHPESSKAFAIVRDNAAAVVVQAQWPDTTVYTLDECCRLLDSRSLVNAVKDTFHGATVTGIVDSPGSNELNDEIPF